MPGMGLTAGIGQALAAGTSEYQNKWEQERTRKRQEDIQNTLLTREKEQYDAQQQTQEAQDMLGASNLQAFADPNINPFHIAEQTVMGLRNPQTPQIPQAAAPGTPQDVQTAQPTPTAPGERPVASGAISAPASTPTPPSSTGGLANIKVPGPVSAPIAPQTQALPTGWKPMDPGLAQIYDRYEPMRQRVEADIAKIKARSGGDPKVENRMMSAYGKVLEKDPNFMAMNSAIQSYVGNAQTEAVAQKANKFLDAFESGDTQTLESMFGKGAHAGKDPQTGMPGVILPNGMVIGQNLARARVMLRLGMIDNKNFSDIAKEETIKTADMLKAKMEIEGRIREAGVVRRSTSFSVSQPAGVTQAAEVQRTAEQNARMNGSSPQDAARAGVKAKLDYLMTNVSKIDDKQEVEKAKIAQQNAKNLQAAVKAIYAPPDADGLVKPKIDQKQALATFDTIAKTDPEGALVYSQALPPAMNDYITAQLNVREAKKATESGLTGNVSKGAHGKMPEPKSQPETMQHNGKTYYRWPDGTYHTKKP